jgi:hypothetical protein
MARDRRDRERAICPRCGKNVTVRRDGGLMAHRLPDGDVCVDAAYRQRQAEQREAARRMQEQTP